MKKIEELFASLTDHQLIIDGLSEIKVEAINKYWLGGKLQQPKGEDATTSEIKRLLLVAFAPDNSLPALYRNAPRLRTSPTYKSDFQYYRNEENFEPAGTLTITKEFEVIPTSFYPAIFEALQTKIVRIATDAYDTHFSTGKIEWLNGVKELQIHGNFFGSKKLEMLPENIGDLKSLEELTVIRTEISAIPESLYQLSKLKKLDLRQNKITSLGSEISNLKSLELLDVSMNRLERIPDALEKVTSLKEVKVYDNPFMEISDFIALNTYRYNYISDPKSKGFVELKFPKEVLVINKSWIDVSLSRIEEIIIKNKITTLRVESVAMLNRILTPDTIQHFKNIRCLDLQWNSWSNLQYEKGFFKEMAVKIKLPSNEEAAIIELPESIGLMTWLEEVNLKGNKIQKLPQGLFQLSELKKLNLYGNKMAELPDSFSSLTKLTHLNLSNIEFASIPKSIFSLGKLQVLDLSWNKKIVELSPSIAELKNLEELNLESNALTEIPDEIGGLKKLKKVSLSYNKLTAFPESILKLEELESLEIGNQQIAELPKNLKGLANLKHLELKSAGIKELSDSIGDLKSLESLDLERNDIVSISESISNCKSLSSLILANNRLLKTLPEGISELKKLEFLQLYHCEKLESLPSSISALKNLKVLDISYSLISELPKAVFELSSLVELKLFQLPITVLGSAIKNLKNLEYLDLRLTKITEFPSEIGELKNLKKIDGCTLSKPLPSSFCDLSNLNFLDVNFENVDNPLPENFGDLKNLENFSTTWSKNIVELPESFAKLDNLKRLSLRNTQFKEFPLVLTELKNIGHLDLMDNQFAEVPEELAKMKSLHLIHFDNNPLASSAAIQKKCSALLPGVYFSF
jgi:Leucine-rich repeat (LRR) protein